MTTASYILAINLFIAALFALAFFLVAVNNRSSRVAIWFSLAYLFGIAYVLGEFMIPLQGDPALTYTLSFGAFMGAMCAVTIGISRHYRIEVPWTVIGFSAVISLAANWYGYGLEHESVERMVIYQAPYAFMQAIAAMLVWRSKRRQPIDIGLFTLFAFSTVQFLSKPLVALLTGGSGDSPAAYFATNYALYSQSIGAVLQVATGLVMLMVLVRDMMLEITARSETDLLSQLYNRRGFETFAVPAMASGMQKRIPVALVMADLDAFKQINDSYGHDAGDIVISAFARLLRETAPGGAVLARMGGEEFAVLLPGTNLAAARLFAEAVRSSFAQQTIDEVRLNHTASFGVAEACENETLSELRRRADTALYAAKRAGRNRVASAEAPGADEMPAHPLEGSTLLSRRA